MLEDGDLRPTNFGRRLWRRHWTPSYLFYRAKSAYDARRHPEDPWLARDAVKLLAARLKPTDVGLQWGSGNFTRWFGKRTHHGTPPSMRPTTRR